MALEPPFVKPEFGPRRARAAWIDAGAAARAAVEPAPLEPLERLDLAYRTLCGVLYNFVPTSGHPGGSISSGRFVEALLYGRAAYELGAPDRLDADVIVYAAGHKALGLYAMWALRNELCRIARPDLLGSVEAQLRFEDLLGFRRSPVTRTPLFIKFGAKALDGHPTPQTPFVRLATGASGVGLAAAIGHATALLDLYGERAPIVHIIEGEGGLTPGRVQEAMAAAAAGGVWNAILHVDWNQSSIDSDRVCREGASPGDYVQWDPAELAYFHDWNSVRVADGHDFRQVFAAQELAERLATGDDRTGQPTAVIYRTVKGWRYGIEGRRSHGAGHKFCSEAYYEHVALPFEKAFGVVFPRFEGDCSPAGVERLFFETLLAVRGALERDRKTAEFAAARVASAGERLAKLARRRRDGAPRLEAIYDPGAEALDPAAAPPEIALAPGAQTTLREALGEALRSLNRKTDGALFAAAADLLDSTSIARLAEEFDKGYWHSARNARSRLLSLGGICEDAAGAFMSGLSAAGGHIGVTSSYGAFVAALEHVSARLHGIGQQARFARTGEPYRTWIMVCAHAGVKTGEDGPTHADPQALQLLQGCFPKGVLITLTPWEPAEVWPLVAAGLWARPAVLAPFVTRPAETVPDRAALGLAPASAAAQGLYALVRADRSGGAVRGTLVLQGSEVTLAFVAAVLPELRRRGITLDVYYVSSAELFERLPADEQERIFPEERAREAMGITGFTLPTLERFVLSREGRRRSLHPFRKGHYLGSGRGEQVMEEAGLDPASQLAAILEYVRVVEHPRKSD